MTTKFQQASEEHVRRLNRLVERGGVQRLRKMYDSAQADLERKLARAIGRGSAPFTVHQYRVLLAHVRTGQMQLAGKLGDESARITEETQSDALRGLIRQVKQLETLHDLDAPTLPIEEASRFAGILDKYKTSLLKQSRESMARYGAHVVQKIERDLTLSLVTGDTTAEAVERVATTADVEFWRAERIVRSEQSWAAHSAIVDGMRASADALGQMYLRWTELVSDAGTPLDNRVGADSVAMHGQVALPGEEFTMPGSARRVTIVNRYGRSRVSDDMIGRSWLHPPCRPNGRETVVPWRPGWGGKGWRVVGGEKVPVTR